MQTISDCKWLSKRFLPRSLEYVGIVLTPLDSDELVRIIKGSRMTLLELCGCTVLIKRHLAAYNSNFISAFIGCFICLDKLWNDHPKPLRLWSSIFSIPSGPILLRKFTSSVGEQGALGANVV